MNEQVDEVESLRKLRSFIEEDQVNYLDSCIENIENKNEVNKLLE